MSSGYAENDHSTRKKELEELIEKGSVLVDNFLELAQLNFDDNEYQKVIDIATRALAFTNNPTDNTAVYFDIALGYYSLQNISDAKNYFQKSVDFASSLDDSCYKIEMLGINHYFLRCCVSNETEITHHANKAKHFYESLIDKCPDADAIEVAYEYLGYICLDFAAYEKAIEYFGKSLDKTSSDEHMKSCYLGISESYRKLGDIKTAEKYSKMASHCTTEGHA